jgi:surface polysaccharide O-acyltransferase-like enzyme
LETDARGETPTRPPDTARVASLDPRNAVGMRLAYVDALKVVAILAVASIHIFGVAIDPNAVGSAEWWMAAIPYYSSFWAVPVFVMASGAVVIGSTSSPREFYARRATRLVPAAALFVPLYIVFAARFQDGPSTLPAIVALLASGRPYNHLYFLPLIAGLYAITPLLGRALRGAPRGWVWVTALGLLGMAMADAVLGHLGGGGFAPTLVTWWIPFVGYYVLGYALATSRRRLSTPSLLIALVFAIAAANIFVWWSLTVGGAIGAYTGTYLSVHVAIVSVLVFLLFKSADSALTTFGTLLASLALLTFGVYLGHVLVGSALFALLRPAHTFGGLGPVYVGTVVLSFAIAAVVARVPVVRRLIGL